MIKWKVIASLALMLAVVNLFFHYQQHASKAGFLAAEDYLEIQQLYSYYARDVDSGSQRDASWMYTEDGVWEVEGVVSWRGKEELKEHYTTLPPGVTKNGIRHFTTNLILVPTDEGVRGSIYMLGVQRRVENAPLEINMMGKYEDLLIKTAKGWRFKHRTFRSDSWYDSDKQVLPSPFTPVN